MKFALFPLLVFLAGCATVPTQSTRRDAPYIDRTKPTVYMTFDGEAENPWPDDDIKDWVWLRLHNNTRWPIRLVTRDGEPKDLRVVHMVVPLEDLAVPRGVSVNPEPPPRVSGSAACFAFAEIHGVEVLSPGHSWRLRVPASHIAKLLAVVVPFHYAWEHGMAEARGNEPTHTAVFVK